MARKLFGENITPSCSHCSYGIHNGDKIICEIRGEKGIHDSCHKFKYDPIKRIPKSKIEHNEWKPEDFSIE